MSSESQVILDVWEAVRDHVPHGKRGSIAQQLLYSFEVYGFDAMDCASIVDEDPDLAAAFFEVFPEPDDGEEDDTETEE